MNHIKSVAVFIVLMLFLFGTKNVLASTSCTVITKNLTSGSTNSNSGKQVTPLQDFLYSFGYLTSTPTGHFGNLTTSAVKKFQTSKNISSTGTVGPLTQAAIKKVSCVVSVIKSTPVVPIPVQNTPTPVQTPAVSENNLITIPQAGTQLTMGQKYPIQWTGNNNQTILSVILDNENGVSAGYILGGVLGINSYDWTVGNVSVAGQSTSVVPPGNYRIHIIDQSSYGSAFNIKSGVFSIKETPLLINNILPSAVPVKGNTSVVLYGSGFGVSTRINFSGSYNQVLTPQYISPDKKLIWFYVPQNNTPGQYQVSVYNDYSLFDSSATSTPSNSVNLQVI